MAQDRNARQYQPMIALGHSSIGAMIGVGVIATLPPETPLLVRLSIAVIVGGISHYLADRIPHGHYEFHPTPPRKNILLFIVDFFGSIGIFLLLAATRFGLGEKFLIIGAGMFGAQLPDMFEGLVTLGIIKLTGWVARHRHFHFVTMHAKTPPHLALEDGTRIWSITDLWQLACLGIALYALV